ncbi:uncharacterized protein LOC107001181 [Solanum pennellii]|uniref:Uncharacterized protein LOC107001181 n=1 Tax=Solanum pennellii TaxID=28526 RepID=A0ABM1FCC3_SOLPN|nr:uncharacterized protein LOC107001181 [Solanum pennellii]
MRSKYPHLFERSGLGKHNHFLALSHPFTAKTEVGVFCKEIVRLYGLPRSILSDRDVVFTSAFLQELFCLSRTRLSARRTRSNVRDTAFHSMKAQSSLKTQADSKRSNLSFNVGDAVFLHLRPYLQKSSVKRLNENLSPRYFGTYKIVRRVGPVSYELQLPQTSKIHPIFHV